jgi:cysteine desulfurase
MLVNNEIGTIQPLREIRKAIDERYADALRKPVLLCDASQAPLALPVNVQSIAADMVVIDAHKCYGPLMTGLLYVKQGTPYIGLCGAPGKAGEQGSPDVGALVAMVRALEIASQRQEDDVRIWRALKTYTIGALQARFPGVRINGAPEQSVPNIVNVSFPNTDGEFLVVQLDAAGIAVSAKSACLSGGGEGSYVVQAVDPERANNSIRISFGRETTRDDIDVLVSVLSDVVK